jgi:hypothetical protein
VPDGARLAAAWQELHQAGGAAMAFAGGLTEPGGANGADGADEPGAGAGVAGVADG